MLPSNDDQWPLSRFFITFTQRKLIALTTIIDTDAITLRIRFQSSIGVILRMAVNAFREYSARLSAYRRATKTPPRGRGAEGEEVSGEPVLRAHFQSLFSDQVIDRGKPERVLRFLPREVERSDGRRIDFGIVGMKRGVRDDHGCFDG